MLPRRPLLAVLVLLLLGIGPAAERQVAAQTGREPAPSRLHEVEEMAVSGFEAGLARARPLLQRYGYHVLAAGSGEEALAIAEREPGDIHLVVTDVVMPGLSGREVAQHFAETRPGSAVLFTSGYTPDDIMRHRVIAEGAPFLQKPFTPAVLAAKVREVLDGKAGGRE